MPRPSQPARLVLAAAVLLLVAALAFTLLSAADSALSVWQRLASMPAWMRYAYLGALAALGAGGAWLVWRLLHPRAAREPKAAPIDRSALEARIERVARDARVPARAARGRDADDAHTGATAAHSPPDAATQARRELAELDARR